MSTAILLTAILGFSAFYFVRQRHVLQLGIFFNVCAAAYMVFGMSIARRQMGSYFGGELDLIAWMCVAAVLGFNLAYMLTKRPLATGSGSVSGHLPSHAVLLAVVGVGFVAAAVAVLLIGPLNFVFMDRIERFGSLQAKTELLYIANLLNVGLPFVLLRHFKLGQRRDLILLIVLLAHCVLFSLLTISRYDLMIVVLAGAYCLERFGKIGPLATACFLVAAIASTLIFKPLLYLLLLARDYAVAVDYGEYVNWIRHTLLLMSSPESELPHDGYRLALRSLFVVRPEEDSLSEWLMQEFFPDRMILSPGTAFGFTGVWEGYSAGGFIGVAAHFAFFGAVFGWLERSPSAIRHVLVIFAMILAYRLFRSEAYNFVKTYAWYFAYPVIAIALADRFMHWASGAGSGLAVGGSGRSPGGQIGRGRFASSHRRVEHAAPQQQRQREQVSEYLRQSEPE